MIIIFTANKKGGVLHYAIQLKEYLSKIYEDVVVYAPEGSDYVATGVYYYKRKTDLLPISLYYKYLASKINKHNPRFLITCESRLIASRLVIELSHRVKCYMTLHDVNEHPSYNGILLELKGKIVEFYAKKAWRKCKSIVLLSNKSYDDYRNKYPVYSRKISLLQIGANEFRCNALKPDELHDEDEFYLFFGRIDKYKGISRLIKAYSRIKKDKPKLLIAGSGSLLQEDLELIEREEKILIINRYISDGEAVYLFDKCLATILPYSEASQSGVLFLSYYFSRPVVVSNIQGLREYVEVGETGFIFSDTDELVRILSNYQVFKNSMSDCASNYYKEYLSWDKNILKWLADVEEV